MTNIAGREFSAQTMSGRKYVYEYPGLLQAVVDSSGFEAGHSDVIPLPDKLYLQYGELVLNASPNKRFYPGMLLTLSGDNNATKGYAAIVSYDGATGLMTLVIEGYSGAVIFGPFLRIEVSVNGDNFSSATPHVAFNKGTSSKTPKEMFSAFRLNSPEIQAAEIRDDFISPVSLSSPSPYSVIFVEGLGNFYSYPKAGTLSSFSPENRAGFAAVEVKNASDSIAIQRGSANRNILFGNETLFLLRQFSFFIPVLSDITDEFKFLIGFMSNGSSPDLIFDAGGYLLSYTHTENSGKFRFYYGTSGTYVPYDTSVTCVAGTWYKLEFRVFSDYINVYLNGVLVSSVSDADLVGSGGEGDVFSPAFQLTKVSGSSERVVILDYYSSKEEAAR